MKRLLLLTLLVLPLLADSPAPLPKEIIGVGVSYNDAVSKHAIPNFFHGVEMASPGGVGMYEITNFQVTGVSRHPLQAQTVMTEDMCAITRTIGEYVVLGGCLGGGVAATGTNVGGAVDGGGFAGYRFGPSGHWNVVGRFEAVKTALSKTVPSVGLYVVFGWGK